MTYRRRGDWPHDRTQLTSCCEAVERQGLCCAKKPIDLAWKKSLAAANEGRASRPRDASVQPRFDRRPGLPQGGSTQAMWARCAPGCHLEPRSGGWAPPRYVKFRRHLRDMVIHDLVWPAGCSAKSRWNRDGVREVGRRTLAGPALDFDTVWCSSDASGKAIAT